MNKKTITTVAGIIVVIALVAFASFMKSGVKTDIKNNSNSQEQMDTNQTQPKQEGVASNGDVVFVQYTGKLADGKVFDSSIPRGEPFPFILGAGMVIPGWEKGILGMKIGEKKTLTISPEDGYGDTGVKNPQTGEVVIPPNATLIFDVELVDIKRQ